MQRRKILKQLNIFDPTVNAQINPGITVELQDKIHAMLTILPALLNLGMKHKNDNGMIKDKGYLIFNMQNQNFTQQLTFKKHEIIGSLIILNEIPNETFTVEYHVEKKGKKRKKLNDFKYLKTHLKYI